MVLRIKYCDLKPKNVINWLSQRDSVTIIEGFPADEFTINKLINQLGEPIAESRSTDLTSIFEVKVKKEGEIFESFATSNFYFPLHTDCSDFENIPTCVALYCLRPSQEGGESLFVQLSQIIPHLPEDMLSLLRHKKWAFRNVKRAILVKDILTYRICYNRITMESYSLLSSEEMNLLDRFDQICRKYQFQLQLKAKELILFRNDKLLHGRNGFPEDSQRLLKRIRFFLKEK